MNDKGNIATVDEYLKLSKDDRKKALDEGRFQIPSKKLNPAEREKFDKYGWENSPKLEESAPAAAAVPEVKPEDKKPDVIPSAPATAADGKTPESAPAKVADQRFKSLEEAEKAFEERDKLVASQQEIINRLNSTSSANGRQVKELQGQLAAVQEKLKNLPAPAAKVEEFDLPDPPEPPDLDKFEDDGGVNSEEYQKARAKYDKEQANYLKKFKPILKSVSEIRKENQELKVQAEEFKSFRDQSLNEKAMEIARQSASEVDLITDELQKELGLATTVSWKNINDNLTTANDATVDPAVRELSKKFVDELPATDKANFKKLAKAVGLAFDFSSGVARKVMDIKSNKYRGSLLDEGFTFVDKPKDKADIDLELIRRKQEQQGASGIPPSAMGADENLHEAMNAEEKVKKLNDITEQLQDMQAKGQSIKKSSLYQELIKLRVELGYR
jgi:hypothetical protein